jgi:predicted ATPase
LLQKLEITNYRSIAQATVALQPFTILVGANGSGKSNLLMLLADLSRLNPGQSTASLSKHLARGNEPTRVVVTSTHGKYTASEQGWNKAPELNGIGVFSIDPRWIGGSEQLAGAPPVVQANGSGAIQVLDSLKTGDREDLFNSIEQRLREFVPEIEKLSFVPGGQKRLQVRERDIPLPVPLSEASEGTRLVLTILTIVYQERPPRIICIEDIDRGLHPALFGKVVEVCRALVTGPNAPQIIATTHNPYFVDQFVDDEDSVVLVEKTNGNTSFTPLSERLRALGERTDSLGSLWYSGLVGAVPPRELKHLPKASG